MKKSTLFLALAGLICLAISCMQSCAQSKKSTSSLSASFAKNLERAKALVPKLTLEDKIGEMTQFSIDVLAEGQPYNLKEPLSLDEAKLRKVLVELRTGSILNVGGHAYTREEWRHIITTIQQYAKEKASGIPVLYGIDAVHGANYTLGATLFPQQLGLAATWNLEMARKTGAITAYETRASGIPWSFSPVLDIGRDPRWPRLWETFGEDVHLATLMGVEMVRGYQGDSLNHPHHAAACLKHFLGYSMPWTGKDRTQAWIPERQLKEYFIPMFKAAIDAGALTIMINSGEINGIPVHINPAILKDLLRDEMGFQGFTVSDWEDVVLLVSRHRVAKDFKEAIQLSVNAGMDMVMVPLDLSFPVLLKELVEEGKVPMSRIDEAVTRILAVKFELGLFDNPYFPFESYDKFASEEHTQAAYEAAAESIVLLKNDGNVLPISKTSKVLVTGPTANSLNALNGGWTGTWQGADPRYNTPGKKTILEAIQDETGKSNVTYLEGTSFDEDINTQQAAAAARGKDYAIICLGEMPYNELPGNIEDMNLPKAQIDLVKAIANTGTPVILVLVEGRPRLVREGEPLAKAVLAALLPGNEGSRAVADILFGDINPSGKLPITYPRFPNSLLTYDHKGTDLIKQDFSNNAFNPQWEFGHGLSYSTFSYSDLKLDKDQLSLSGNDQISVSVKVANTGDKPGKEVVQLYVTDKVASITPAVKRLRGFAKIELQPGEAKDIKFTLNVKDLAFVGVNNSWVTEAGEFEVSIAGLKAVFHVE